MYIYMYNTLRLLSSTSKVVIVWAYVFEAEPGNMWRGHGGQS